MKLLILGMAALLIGFIQPVKMVYNIPSLKNKSIIEIRKILGKPSIDEVSLNYKTQSGVQGNIFFNKNGFTLKITYNLVNNKVIDFYISKKSSVSDCKILEIAANVLTSNEFILTPVKDSKDSLMFTGVTITPK